MQYKINTKAFHEAFKEPSAAFYKNWTCPVHGPRDYCSHYTEAFEKFKSEFMKKFIEPYSDPRDYCSHYTEAFEKFKSEFMKKFIEPYSDPLEGVKPHIKKALTRVRGHIAKKLVARPGYEYGWKTLYFREEIPVSTADSDYSALYRRMSDYQLDKNALLGLGADGWIPLGYLDDSYHIPKNADGFYADGDAVLCMRIKYTKDSYKTNPEIYPLAQVVSEGCPVPDGTADIERDIANNFETLMDDTYYSMGNKHYKMPAENNELGATPMQTKDIVEHAKKHIVPGWEDNEANRIARKAVENMDRLESLGLKKQGETVDPRDVLLTDDAIKEAIKNLTIATKEDKELFNFLIGNRKTTEDSADELSLNQNEILKAVFGSPVTQKITEDGEVLEVNCFYPEVLEDKVFETVTADPVPIEPAPEPKGYIYTGADAEVWAPIMENMESNIAKANALEKAKESFPLDALTLIMGYHFGKNTADEMDDKRIDFIEKYRSLITVMGYSRF